MMFRTVCAISFLALMSYQPLGAFVRGDTNADGTIGIADAISLLSCLFTAGGGCPTCDDAADANDDGALDIADAIYGLSYLFLGGPAPPLPTPTALSYPIADCGPDPTPDTLGCVAFAPCP